MDEPATDPIALLLHCLNRFVILERRVARIAEAVIAVRVAIIRAVAGRRVAGCQRNHFWLANRLLNHNRLAAGRRITVVVVAVVRIAIIVATVVAIIMAGAGMTAAARTVAAGTLSAAAFGKRAACHKGHRNNNERRDKTLCDAVHD